MMKKIVLIIISLLTFVCVSAQEDGGGSVVGGYRICVFNGTQQNARTLANQAVSEVRGNFSTSIATKMIYDAPVFKVLVGACLNRTEATVLLVRLRRVFPNAFIVNDKIKVDEFLGTPSMTDSNIEPQEPEKSADGLV